MQGAHCRYISWPWLPTSISSSTLLPPESKVACPALHVSVCLKQQHEIECDHLLSASQNIIRKVLGDQRMSLRLLKSRSAPQDARTQFICRVTLYHQNRASHLSCSFESTLLSLDVSSGFCCSSTTPLNLQFCMLKVQIAKTDVLSDNSNSAIACVRCELVSTKSRGYSSFV